jgi:5-methylcytosine-specific restriction endonuclease McrA
MHYDKNKDLVEKIFKELYKQERETSVMILGFIDNMSWFCKRYYGNSENPTSSIIDSLHLIEIFKSFEKEIKYILEIANKYLPNQEPHQGWEYNKHLNVDEDWIEDSGGQRTQNFIFDFLDPFATWATKNEKERWERLIKGADKINYEYVRNFIRKRPYEEFLKTPYWKAIAGKVRVKFGYKCILCSSSQKISIHHKTYENHGDELRNLDDLIVLCGECHAKFHDKLEDVQNKPDLEDEKTTNES